MERDALDNCQNKMMVESSLNFGHPPVSPVGNGPAAPPKLGRLPNAIDRMAHRLSSLMANLVNRYPDNLTQLYSWVFESLDPTESKELLQQWIPAIEGEQPPLFHQNIQNWPSIKDIQGILLSILCGNHDRNLPLGKLYTSMNESSVHSETKAKLKMTMALRKNQLQSSPEHISHKVTNSTLFSFSSDQWCRKLTTLHKSTLLYAGEIILHEFGTMMCKQINRSPEKLADIYKFILGVIPPTESEEILRYWILAIESDDSCQGFNDWPLGKDTQEMLLFILYGSHGLTLGKLNSFLQRSSVRLSTKRTVKKVIFLRKLQLEAIRQRRSGSSPASATDPHQRRFTCGICHKKFKKRYKLREHFRAHTGEKPFFCSHQFCSKAFSRKYSRDRHLRDVH